MYVLAGYSRPQPNLNGERQVADGQPTDGTESDGQPADGTESNNAQPETNASRWTRLLDRWPWLPFFLPLIVYFAVHSFVPKPPNPEAGPSWWVGFAYEHYPIIYTIKIALTLASVIFVWPGIRRFEFRVRPEAFLVGILGIFVWVGLCSLRLEQTIFDKLGLGFLIDKLGLGFLIDMGARSGFNPLEQLQATPAWAWGFLGIRFLGLVLLVPIMEEFFWRGFLWRFIQEPDDWATQPFGSWDRAAAILTTLAVMLAHPPGEWLAALVWFSLVTWLMLRTKNIWDCVVAHAVTNLLLGVYVLSTNNWHLM
ncbi:MAG: CAAX prenyl protease-related protein [Planctomycetales bacterium]